MLEETDVLVVGAGPVGLTVALALERLNLRVRVLTRDAESNREPRADVIFPRAGEALGAIGVGEVLRRHSYEMQGAEFYGDGRHMGSFTAGRFASAYPRAMTVEQHDIEQLLVGELAARGVDVEWQSEVTDVRPQADRVDVTICRPHGGREQISAPWVVACDGKQSTLRDRLGIPFEGHRRKNMQVLQGNVIPSWDLGYAPGHGYFFLAPRRTVLAFPIPGGAYRVFCVRDDPHPRSTDMPTLGELRDVVAEAAHMPDLQMTLAEPVWLNRVRVADRVAANLRRGRVLLAGDAAHVWTPIGGHGMNVGMLGAHNLAWKLAAVHRGQAVDALLDSYDVEQRALAHGVIRDMKFNVMEVLLPQPVHQARCAFLRATMSSEAVQRRSEWMMSDFGRNHRKSPLSWHQARTSRGSLRAGDRLPDAMVVPARTPATDGQRTMTAVAGARQVRLHNLLGYDHWTLLLTSDAVTASTMRALRAECAAVATPVEITVVTAAGRDDSRELGRPGDVTLVRPDGYVGLVAPLERLDVLREYLRTHLTPTRSVRAAPSTAAPERATYVR